MIRQPGKRCGTLLVLVLSLLSFDKAVGQEGNGLTFHEAIQRLAEARSRIKSYDVTITGKIDSKVEFVRLSNGSTYEVEEIPTGFTLNMVFDREQSRLLVARQNTHRLKSTGEIVTSEWNIFGRTLETLPKGQHWTIDRGRYIGKHTAFFDPLGLGLGFEAEFRRGEPWETIVENYHQWSTVPIKQRTDGMLQFEDHQYSIVIDPERDYWPITMTNRGNREIISIKTNLTHAKIHGQWLPEAGTVFLKDETTRLKFEWHSVNQPIPKNRFTSWN